MSVAADPKNPLSPPLPTQAAMYERRIKNLSDEMGPGPNYAGYPLGLLLALTRAS